MRSNLTIPALALALCTACTPGPAFPSPSSDGTVDDPAGAAADPTDAPQPSDEEPAVADTGAPASAMPGFSWVVDDLLAGLPLPGGAYDRSTRDDLRYLSQQGVDELVSLTITPPDPDLVDALGLAHTHLPIPDFQAPTPSQIDAFVARVEAARSGGSQVAVHCHAGMGRTGTLLATWFVYDGLSASEAIDRVRLMRPGSIESASQLQSIHSYAGRLAALQDAHDTATDTDPPSP